MLSFQQEGLDWLRQVSVFKRECQLAYSPVGSTQGADLFVYSGSAEHELDYPAFRLLHRSGFFAKPLSERQRFDMSAIRHFQPIRRIDCARD